MSDARDGRTARSRPEPAVRLTCTVEEDGVRVVARRRVTKVVPPSDPIDQEDRNRSGFWIEVRDVADRARYRRVQPDPLARTVEVPAEDGGFTAREVDPRGTTFSVLVPDLDDGDHVALLRGGADPGPAGGPRTASPGPPGPTEVARLALRGDEREERR